MADQAPDWYKPPTKQPATPDWYKPPEKPQQQETKPEPHSSIRDVLNWVTAPVVAPVETALSMGTGMIAKPISDVAGLSALAKEIISPTPGGGDPEGFKQDVQRSLTYEPRTAAGQALTKYNPLALLGRGIDYAGSGAQQLIAPPGSGAGRQMLGAGVHEAMNQAPGFLGIKGGRAGADVAAGAMREGAESWMNSALKPGMKATKKSLKTPGEGPATTMLDEGINVSKGGYNKINNIIGDINIDIQDRIQNSKAIVKKDEVGARINDVLDRFTKQISPSSDLASIQKVYDDFMNHPLLPTNDIPVQLAQELKTGTHRSLGSKSYGELKNADVEAQKALVRGIKEDIANSVPEVGNLNARESKLLEALPLVERRVLMDANKNPVGLGILSLDKTRLAAWMADRSPLFKSLVARMLNQGAKVTKASGKAAPAAGVAVTQSANQLQPPPDQDQ